MMTIVWLPRVIGVSEIPEMPVRLNVGHCLAVDDQGGAGFGASDDLDDVALQLGAVDFEEHVLLLALRHQGELVGFARVADVAFIVNRAHSPEIVARIEAGEIDGGCSVFCSITM